MVWTEARPENDFRKVQPLLEKTLDLSRKYGDFFPGYEHIADPLIDFADYGMKASSVRALFADLRAQQVPIMKAITAQAKADDSCLHGNFPEAKQIKFAEDVIRTLGYDFNRGRIDKTASSVHDQVLARGCAHHHARQGKFPRRKFLQRRA